MRRAQGCAPSGLRLAKKTQKMIAAFEDERQRGDLAQRGRAIQRELTEGNRALNECDSWLEDAREDLDERDLVDCLDSLRFVQLCAAEAEERVRRAVTIRQGGTVAPLSREVLQRRLAEQLKRDPS